MKKQLLSVEFDPAIGDRGPLHQVDASHVGVDLDLEYTIYDHIVPSNDVDYVDAWEKSVTTLRREAWKYRDEALLQSARRRTVEEHNSTLLRQVNHQNHVLWIIGGYINRARQSGADIPTMREIYAEASGTQLEMQS